MKFAVLNITYSVSKLDNRPNSAGIEPIRNGLYLKCLYQIVLQGSQAFELSNQRRYPLHRWLVRVTIKDNIIDSTFVVAAHNPLIPRTTFGI
jgi:hypothetical protein